MTASPGVAIRDLAGFADHDLPAPTVFQTAAWQDAWWQSFGRGELLLLAADSDDRVTAVAPLFADSGTVYSVGAGGSDYLDLVGHPDAATVAALLQVARDRTPGFEGFCFHHVRDDSPTGGVLAGAADLLGLRLLDEGTMPAPVLELRAPTDRAPADKKSLRRHEAWFARNGELDVEHLTDPVEVLPLLSTLFDQHIHRWEGTSSPSLFLSADQQEFYRRLTASMGAEGWLRFTTVKWNGAVVACHLGFSHRGTFLWYKPTFDVALSKRSPGEVLLRHLLLRAIEEGADLFDFGLGDEPFKHRFATRVETVRTWSLRP